MGILETEYSFDNSIQKVAYVLDHIPPYARNDSVALILSYWMIHDNIQIPEDVLKELREKATSPETILRAQRKAKEYARKKKILETLNNVQGLTDPNPQEEQGG